MMPNPYVSRDDLSQILFVFIGSGLDIIEFISETKKVTLKAIYIKLRQRKYVGNRSAMRKANHYLHTCRLELESYSICDCIVWYS